ncbi:MAG: mechanosensitive ion channel family protein [Ardenticatenaceae bacterium]|nr:mechanosensitive ion channel family protein [Ardenticatenaceae bacterium]
MNQDSYEFFQDPNFLIRVCATVAVLLLIWITRRVALRLVTKSTSNTSAIYTWRKVSEYLSLMVGGVLIALIWVSGLKSASTFLGLLSAGLAVASQDVIANLLGWIYLLARRPVEVGDRIEIGDKAGDVIDIHWFHMTVLEIRSWVDADQNTGRLITIPNRCVFSQPMINFTSGIPHIWNEVPVIVTFESDWHEAKQLLFEIADRHSLHPSPDEQKVIREAARGVNIHLNYLTPNVYVKVAGSGVVLTLRYLCNPRQRRSSEQAIWEEVLDTFAERSDIDFAYDTQRVFYHPVEGKTAPRPETTDYRLQTTDHRDLT